MGTLVPLAAHHHPPRQKRHPFGIAVPRSPEWPPYQYALVPGSKATKVPGPSLFDRFINVLFGFTPSDQSDIQQLAGAVGKKLRELGIVVNEDTKAAYNSNLKYSHEILQYVQAVGRAAELDLEGEARDIRALVHDLRHDVKALDHNLAATKKELEKRIVKGDALATARAVHITQRWVDKYYGHKVNLTYGWFKNRDTWFRDRVTKWWKVIYKRDVRPIKTQSNNQSIQVSLIWATINAEIKPTLKLVAKAGSWLKWFAHWKRDALLAFGTLKAGEVAAWLERKYV